MSEHLSTSDPHVAREADYLADMIGQLADQARGLGETEVALHLEAIANARRYSLNSFDAGSDAPAPIRRAERRRSA